MSDTMARLTAALADRYRVTRELGAGGMATVYLAHDRKHARDVAIKVLRRELTDLVGRERFLREIRVAATLSHPHILPLLDSDEVEGQLFYVMPLVRGESLRTRLQAGPLPVADAVRLVTETAFALEHAHQAGIVHRDIKPENILLQGGQALVTDFGIARAADTVPGNTLTQAGMSVGTPAYMSPEQAVGDVVDGRSDQYALACVLYECLVGEPPFTGPTAQAVIAKRFVQTPADVHALREGVPRPVALAMQRALQRTPIDRFDSMAGFAAALDAGMTAAAERSAPKVPEQSVAVLAFESLGGDADDEFFADGITEEILTALAQHPELRVAGRASSFSFKGKRVDPRDIATQLGVRTVLDGSVRRSRDRVRITARLLDATDGYQLWSERYDRELHDVFVVQDEIASAIARKLQATLAVAGASRRQRTTPSVEAYEAYLKGRVLLDRRGRHIAAGLAQMERAVMADPTYALAWAGIAETYSLMAYYGLQHPETLEPVVREASAKAIQYGPDLAEASAARGAYELLFAWNWRRAEELFTRAHALDPAYAQGAAWYNFFVRASLLNDWRAGVEGMMQFVIRDPLSAYAHSMLAAVAGLGGAPEVARRAAHCAIDLDPDASLSWHCSLTARSTSDDAADVQRTAYKAFSMSGRGLFSVSVYGLWCCQHGDAEGAQLMLAELETRARREPGHASVRGLLAALLGDDALAAERFVDAIRMRDPQVFQWVNLDTAFPVLRRLRGYRPWTDLLEAAGLTSFLRERGARGWT